MGNFLGSRKGKVVMGFINGFGAAIVIIGAMFKILHLPGGGFVIGLGLAVEAFIFILSAFEPVHEELDWTKAYPELKDESDTEGNHKLVNPRLSDKLDEILAEANIDSDRLKSLHKSIIEFSEAVSSISNFTVSQGAAQNYNEQINNSIEYMNALNSIYAQQIEQRNSQLEIGNKMFEDMRISLESNRKLQSEMQRLSSNLKAINSVYEGMINAMNVKSNQ